MTDILSCYLRDSTIYLFLLFTLASVLLNVYFFWWTPKDLQAAEERASECYKKMMDWQSRALRAEAMIHDQTLSKQKFNDECA